MHWLNEITELHYAFTALDLDPSDYLMKPPVTPTKPKNELQREVDRISNSNATVNRIPNEILGYIFTLGTQDEPSTFPVLITGITSHWRETAIRTPSLWSFIRIPSKKLSHSPTSSIQRAQCWLDRSCSYPVIIHIEDDLPTELNPTRLESVANLLSLHLHHTSELSLTLKRPETLYRALRIVQHTPAPILRHLIFRVPFTSRQFPPVPTLNNLFDSNAPQLQSITLTSAPLQWVNNLFDPIKRLSLTYHQEDVEDGLTPTWSQLTSSLSCSSALTDLCLSGLDYLGFVYDDGDASMSEKNMISLPNLRSLELQGSSSNIHRFISLLESSTSSLTSLTLTFLSSAPAPTPLSPCAPAFPSLTSLQIEGPFHPPTFTSLFIRMPLLAHLCLCAIQPRSNLHWFFKTVNTGGLFPKLEEVEVRKWKEGDLGEVVRFLDERSELTAGVRRVVVDECWKVGWDEMGWLKGLVDEVVLRDHC